MKADNASTFHITNGLFNMRRRHRLGREYMEEFRAKFVGKGRAEVGPMAFTRVIRFETIEIFFFMV